MSLLYGQGLVGKTRPRQVAIDNDNDSTTTTPSVVLDTANLLGQSPTTRTTTRTTPRRRPRSRSLQNYASTIDDNPKKWHHLYVLPVLLLEFLALALTRAVLPSILLRKFQSHVYLVMGVVDCLRGFLAFLSCPLFGKLSDVVGRRNCLFVTVLGTCAPVCSLAFFAWSPTAMQLQQPESTILMDSNSNNGLNATMAPVEALVTGDGASEETSTWSLTSSSSSSSIDFDAVHPMAITIFVILLSLSGIFSSTFTLVFAYISDTVHHQEERVSAYGLALATFGLSFTIGPMAGGYLAAQYQNIQYVFITSLLLTLLDLLYIYLILPESKQWDPQQPPYDTAASVSSVVSRITMDHNFTWNPADTLRMIATDPFLRKVGEVAFLYYTGLWALISTLSVYAVQRFHLSPERLGELMSALGLCTMIAEAVLVRIVVPMMGEKRATKLGLISFALQCIILGFAYESWHLFACAAFSLAGNMVYPSLSSLVSGSVEPDAVGEALGAVNGIKALTEGIGPLVFGSLMTLSEKSALPGWPYLLASVLVILAYKAADDLPDPDDDEYIHELDRGRFNKQQKREGGIVLQVLGSGKKANAGDDEDDDEYGNLLSEIDTSSEGDEGEHFITPRQEEEEDENDLSRLPRTFAALWKGRQSKTKDLKTPPR